MWGCSPIAENLNTPPTPKTLSIGDYVVYEWRSRLFLGRTTAIFEESLKVQEFAPTEATRHVAARKRTFEPTLTPAGEPIEWIILKEDSRGFGNLTDQGKMDRDLCAKWAEAQRKIKQKKNVSFADSVEIKTF